MVRFIFQPEHIEFLREHYPALTLAELTAAFNAAFSLTKSTKQILACTKNHGIKNGRKKNPKHQPKLLTSEQIAFLETHYKTLSRADVTAALNKQFNLALAEKQIIAFVKNHKINSGRNGHFPKGLTPWNTGTKGATSANSTSFKKGQRAQNERPIGHERICKKDGYILVKTADKNPYTGSIGYYRQKHVVIWEQINGPTPVGHVINFIDGNKLNCAPENLELITRAELGQFNLKQLNNEPETIRPIMRNIIKLEIKTKHRERAA